FLQTHTLFPEAMGAGGVIGATDETFMFFQVLKHDLRIYHSPTAIVTHVYEDDPIKQKNRMKEVCSAIVALHLKLLIEESGFHFATLKLLVRALNRGFGGFSVEKEYSGTGTKDYQSWRGAAPIFGEFGSITNIVAGRIFLTVCRRNQL